MIRGLGGEAVLGWELDKAIQPLLRATHQTGKPDAGTRWRPWIGNRLEGARRVWPLAGGTGDQAACSLHPAFVEKAHLRTSACFSERPSSQASSTESLGQSTQIHGQSGHVINPGFTVVTSQVHPNVGEGRF